MEVQTSSLMIILQVLEEGILDQWNTFLKNIGQFNTFLPLVRISSRESPVASSSYRRRSTSISTLRRSSALSSLRGPRGDWNPSTKRWYCMKGIMYIHYIFLSGDLSVNLMVTLHWFEEGWFTILRWDGGGFLMASELWESLIEMRVVHQLRLDSATESNS